MKLGIFVGLVLILLRLDVKITYTVVALISQIFIWGWSKNEIEDEWNTHNQERAPMSCWVVISNVCKQGGLVGAITVNIVCAAQSNIEFHRTGMSTGEISRYLTYKNVLLAFAEADHCQWLRTFLAFSKIQTKYDMHWQVSR